MSKDDSTTQSDEAVFPFEPDEIRRGQFRVIEPSEIASRADVDALMRLMWQERECDYLYYISKNGPGSAAIAQAHNCGELLMEEAKRRYYRHPRFDQDYIHIPDGNGAYRWEWEKKVVEKGPEYWRFRLRLAARKIVEFDTLFKIELEKKHLRVKDSVSKLARAVQPVHFEDFSGQQFERLVFAYHMQIENWRTLEWYGQSGGDCGRDIWGVRETGESLCIQCKNRKATSATEIID